MTFDAQEVAINIMNAVMGLLVVGPALYVLGAIVVSALKGEPLRSSHHPAH